MLDFLKKNEKKIWFLSLAVIFCVTFCLFYFFFREYIVDTSTYQSDFKAHLRSAMKKKGYSLQGRIFKILYLLGNDKVYFLAAFMSVIVILTIVAIYYLFVELDDLTGNKGSRVLYRWSGEVLVFLGPIIVPVLWQHFYKRQFNINAWHNGTYMEMRLFTILTLIYYLRIEKDYLTKKMQAKNLILFSVCLFITTFFKPSFFMGFSFVMAFYLLADLLRGGVSQNGKTSGEDLSFWERFKKILLFGSMVLPTCVVALMQYDKLFGIKIGDSAADRASTATAQANTPGIAFDIARRFQPGATMWVSLLLFLPIPLIVLIYNRKKWKQPEYKWYRICFWIFVLEFLIWFCLKETGRRASAGNFGWGRMIGQFIWVMNSLYLFINNLREPSVTRKDRAYKIAVGLLWVYQLVCGLAHFAYMMTGEYYNV